MSEYDDDLQAARQRAAAAAKALEAWLDRPPGAPSDTPVKVLEEYARTMRASHAQIVALIDRFGQQPELMAALAESADLLKSVGLRPHTDA